MKNLWELGTRKYYCISQWVLHALNNGFFVVVAFVLNWLQRQLRSHRLCVGLHFISYNLTIIPFFSFICPDLCVAFCQNFSQVLFEFLSIDCDTVFLKTGLARKRSISVSRRKRLRSRYHRSRRPPSSSSLFCACYTDQVVRLAWMRLEIILVVLS